MNYKCVRSEKGMKVQALSMNNFSSPLYRIFTTSTSKENLFYWSEIFPNGFFWCFSLHKFLASCTQTANFWKLAHFSVTKAHLKFNFELRLLCFHVQFEQKENKEKWIPFGAYLILTKSVFHAQLHQLIQFILHTAMQRNHTRWWRLKLIDTGTD